MAAIYDDGADRTDPGHQNCTPAPQFGHPDVTRPLGDLIYLRTSAVAQGCRAAGTRLHQELQRSMYTRFMEAYPGVELPLFAFMDAMHHLHQDLLP